MEEFISNLIANSSNFIGGNGRTLAPGPMAASSRGHGPVVLSLEPTGNSGLNYTGGGTSQLQVLPTHNNFVFLNSSTSILRTDMSPMIEWLKSQTGCVANTQALCTSSSSQAHEAYTSEDYRKKIPKPYKELTERDCADLVAQAIRSVVLHTCNDEFRQQCLSKLGASNSRDVEREIKTRLHAIITQEEQQNCFDTENLETDHSLSSVDMNQQ